MVKSFKILTNLSKILEKLFRSFHLLLADDRLTLRVQSSKYRQINTVFKHNNKKYLLILCQLLYNYFEFTDKE